MPNKVFSELSSRPYVFEKRIILEMCAGESEAKREQEANIYLRTVGLVSPFNLEPTFRRKAPLKALMMMMNSIISVSA